MNVEIVIQKSKDHNLTLPSFLEILFRMFNLPTHTLRVMSQMVLLASEVQWLFSVHPKRKTKRVKLF